MIYVALSLGLGSKSMIGFDPEKDFPAVTPSGSI
jgi:hypothetical protein